MDGRWKQTVYVLCAFGFLKDLRPSDSLVTEYLVGTTKNLTVEQVNQDVYPAGTYASLVFTVIVFLVTDLLRYRPIVILEGAAGTATFTALVWGKDIQIMQVTQVCYGLFMACDVAYSTYLFAAMPKSNNSVGEGHRYRQAASLVKVASLTGRVGAAAAGQIVYSLCKGSVEDLHIFSMTAIACSMAVALLLPPVQKNGQYRSYDPVNQETGQNLDILVDGKAVRRTAEIGALPAATSPPPPANNFSSVLSDLISTFGSTNVGVWSLWFILVTCGVSQVSTYVQNLWTVIAEEEKAGLKLAQVAAGHEYLQATRPEMYNGAVSAISTLVGVVATWSVGKIKSGAAIMWLGPTCSTFAGALLLVAARSTSLWTTYIVYGSFKTLGHVILTLASAEVARSVGRVADCHGLVFGVNALFALLMQSLFTIIVTGRGGFQLAVRDQYLVYGGYFIILGAIYGMAVAIVKSVRSWPSPEDRLPKLPVKTPS